MSRKGSNYSLGEVTGLVANWHELQPKRANDLPRKGSGGSVLVRMIDLHRSMRRLPLHMRAAIVLHGLAGLSARECAPLMGVSYQTVLNYFNAGLDWLVNDMNGENVS